MELRWKTVIVFQVYSLIWLMYIDSGLILAGYVHFKRYQCLRWGEEWVL